MPGSDDRMQRRITEMKRLNIVLVSSVFVAMLGLAPFATLAHGQERGTAKATIGSATVSLDYGRPSLKGRDMLKQMPVGGVWRIGSGDPTMITSDADLDFGGTRVPKGKHILLTRLAEPGKWSLVVSSKGAFQYEPSARIAEVPMDVQEAKDSVETLTVNLTGKGGKGVVEIAWGTSRLTASFSAAK
jgi:hypothetical protein